jgi:hypothetical protein
VSARELARFLATIRGPRRMSQEAVEVTARDFATVMAGSREDRELITRVLVRGASGEPRGEEGAPYRCPTPCDEDCELNGWGCHEAHAEPKRQEHDPGACEARMLAASLRWLLGARWEVEVFSQDPAADPLEPWRARPRSGRRHVTQFTAASPGEALARAREWAEREGTTP